MNREIIFRAKHTHTNEFVYGYIFYSERDKCCKIDNGDGILYFCKEETIGEYAGLKDKNGTKIFEGDIIEYKIIEKNGKEVLQYGIVEYDNKKCMFNVKCRGYMARDDEQGKKQITAYFYDERFDIMKDFGTFEVVGNVYDDDFNEIAKQSTHYKK